jgi:GST-like protein
MAGDAYSIADMAIWPWYGALVKGKVYDAAEFLDVKSYAHVLRWTDEIAERPAVQRGRRVNKVRGEGGVRERHAPSDLEP